MRSYTSRRRASQAKRITFRKERITQKSLFCPVDKRDFFVGGPEEIRTLDFYNANVALSQLSYRPIFLTALIIITRGEKKSNPNFQEILLFAGFHFSKEWDARVLGLFARLFGGLLLGSTAPFVST